MICMLLKKKRDELGISNQDLADKANLPLPTVKRVMTQQTDSPTWQTVCSLAEAMGCSLDELAGFPLRQAPESDNELLKQSMDAAQEAIKLCHKGLAEKNTELEKMQTEQETLRKAYLEKCKQVEQLGATVKEKDQQLAEKDIRLEGHMDVIRSKNKWMSRFFLLAMLLLAVLIGLLVFDFLSPTLGFFRR